MGNRRWVARKNDMSAVTVGTISFKCCLKLASFGLEIRHIPVQEILHIYFTRVSVQFSHSVVSDSLRPHESQHARPPCPSPIPGVHSDSHPSSQWCHPAISSSAVPFSSCPQSLPASESFPMSQLFAWGGQSTGVSDLASQVFTTRQNTKMLDKIFTCLPISSSTCSTTVSRQTFVCSKPVSIFCSDVFENKGSAFYLNNQKQWGGPRLCGTEKSLWVTPDHYRTATGKYVETKFTSVHYFDLISLWQKLCGGKGLSSFV